MIPCLKVLKLKTSLHSPSSGCAPLLKFGRAFVCVAAQSLQSLTLNSKRRLKVILSEPCSRSGVYELRPVVGQGIIEVGGRLRTQRISLKSKDARQCV